MRPIIMLQPGLAPNVAKAQEPLGGESADSSVFSELLGNLAEVAAINDVPEDHSEVFVPDTKEGMIELLSEELVQLDEIDLSELLVFTELDSTTLWEAAVPSEKNTELSPEERREEIFPILESLPDDLIAILTEKLIPKQQPEKEAGENGEILTTVQPISNNFILPESAADRKKPELEALWNELVIKLESLIEQVKEPEDLEKISPMVLHYLTNWQEMKKQTGITESSFLASVPEGSSKTAQVFQQLVQLFQQKSRFHHNNVYAVESKVTTRDVVRWLGKVLETSVQERPGLAQTQGSVNLPIAKVEQAVIQLPQTTSAPVRDTAFFEQFKSLMEVKRPVLQSPGTQLAITLKPANLGEMLVRFTQVNGEMIVKIIVTSARSKEMLEGNMQQLRHMFAPHQVAVERQDSLTQQTQHAHREEAEKQEQESKDQHNHDQNRKEKDENESFSSMFEELLLNEKV